MITIASICQISEHIFAPNRGYTELLESAYLNFNVYNIFFKIRTKKAVIRLGVIGLVNFIPLALAGYEVIFSQLGATDSKMILVVLCMWKPLRSTLITP